MMNCPKCGAQVSEGSSFCPTCGNPMGEAQPAAAPVQPTAPVQPVAPVAPPVQMMYVNPADHTAEFDPKDISDNKVMAMLPYLMGTIGIIIALLASKESRYTYFHVRQALKITVVNLLLTIVTLLLCWTVIVPIAGGICLLIMFVINIICFFKVCSGKAEEPAIIRSLNFLK